MTTTTTSSRKARRSTTKSKQPPKLQALHLLILVAVGTCLIPFVLFQHQENIAAPVLLVPPAAVVGGSLSTGAAASILKETPALAEQDIPNEQVSSIESPATTVAPLDANIDTLNTTILKNTTIKPKRIRNRSNRSRLHKLLTNLPPEEHRLEGLNSVDYYACCGLGHRLSKLTDAWYVSRSLKYGLRAFWGFCDHHTEVFDHLFGAQPVNELVEVEEQYQILQLRNEVPGMRSLVRRTEQCQCDGHEDKIALDLELYQSLYDRFQFKDFVHDFMKQHHFSNYTVLGMHIRAGNGETGDFQRKKRGIGNIDDWVQTVSKHLTGFLKAQGIINPLLYIATDTPSMISNFAKALPSTIPIIDLPQDRAESGVLFGEWGAIVQNGSQCLNGWVQAVTDMMLLSSSDIVIAARPSSFVMSMPQAMAFGRNTDKDQKPKHPPFCELPPDGSWFRCYDTYRDWCCTTSTQEVVGGMQAYEYIRMPTGPVNITDLSHKLFKRRKKELVLPMHGSVTRQTDLPYSWTKLTAKMPGQKGR
jgi:hypothetical protein